MANSFFHFKQFSINQDKCAMKVCTDACLFGGWVADKIENKDSIKNILDIGAGTGLLSLMLAQKTNATIDAVELNSEAALQAKENMESSPWKHRVNIFQSNILHFNADKKYDFIISNPPFFEDDLKSDDTDRNTAMHSTSLNLEILLQQINRLLKDDGMAAVLIPYHRTEELENLLKEKGYFTGSKMLARQTEKHGFFRTMLIFSKNECQTNVEQLSIKGESNQYSNFFTGLLKDFYLKL